MKKLLYVLLFVLCFDVQLRSQNPNTAKFPGAVATDQDLFVAKNVARPSVTLTAPVDNATLTLPVTDGTKFRQYQIIGVDLELMQVCSTAALSITACGRGLGGTTAAAHSNGAVIGFPFADVQINQLSAEIKAIESAIITGPLLVGTTTSSGTAKLQVAGNLSLSATSPMITLTTDGTYTWGIKNVTSTGDLQVVKGPTRYIQVGYSSGAVALNPMSGNTLVGTSTDNGTDKLQVNGSVAVQSNSGLSLKNSDGTPALSITTTNDASNRNTSINMTGGVNAVTSNASSLFLGAVNATWGLNLGSTGHSFTGNVGVGKTPTTALDVNGSAALSGTVDSGGLARDTVPATMLDHYTGERIFTDGNIRGITVSKTDPAADSYWYNAANLDVINVNMDSSVTADKWASVYGNWQYIQTDPTSTGEFSGELWGRALETWSGANAGGYLPSMVGAAADSASVGAGALNSLSGYVVNATKDGTGQADFITGGSFSANALTSASTVSIRALDLTTRVTGTSSASNAYGLLIEPLQADGTPTITNAYGLRVDDWSGGGAGSYNIYSAGATSKNKFEGDVRAGTFSTSSNNSMDRGLFSLNVNDTLRWKIGLHASEFGGNVGSTLSFWSYADNGAYLAAPLQIRRTGAVLLNTDTDDGVNRLQVAGGGIWSDKAYSSGTGIAKGKFGAVADNVPRADVAFNTSFSGPSTWNRDDTSKSASLFAMWDGHSDLYVAPSGANPISWVTGLTVLPTGEVSIPKRHQQINFTFYDPSVALTAATIPGLWRAEYGAAAITKVSCMADTADAVIQIKKNTATNVLTANLTCGNGSWTNTTTFSTASFAAGDDLGLQIISGTAKRINVSSQYTGN